MPGGRTHDRDLDPWPRWGIRAPLGARAGRAEALLHEPVDAERLTVEIAHPAAPTPAELAAVRRACARHNLCLYRTEPDAVDPGVLSALATSLGLVRRDRTLDADGHGVAAIHAHPRGPAEAFIPYSTRGLNWHTDGYYLPPGTPIRAVVMHCARPAARGGDTELLDPEAVFLALQQVDPRLPRALARADAFTIPAREDAHGEARPAVTGPVFGRDGTSGALYMRYTARTRSIEWSPAPEVREARDALREILERLPGGRLRRRLRAGEGVICNNVLHRRASFQDAPDPGACRLLYRIRALDRVAAP
jgi:alpha-ketoglutarate-dependent taurine dioxygenase